MFDTKEFVEFSHTNLRQDDWVDGEHWPSVWAYDPVADTFTRDSIKPDPYELIPRVAELIQNQALDAMLVMTGWMTKIDENEDDDEDDNVERMRVRIFLKAGPNMKPVLCIQRSDDSFEVMEDMGEGMFPELFNAAIND